LLASADAVVARAERYAAMVIVNDRADVARLSGAAGVHVGQEDLTPTHVRAVVGSASIVGLSTHTSSQLSAAVGEPVDYIAIGPVFGTTTKDTGYKAVGLSLVQRAAAIAGSSRLPVVAIGGITIDTAPEVVAAGAASVAVITDLLATGDVTSRVRAFLDRLSCV
jgi:thiamine-phosphate pyrophosphorylase